MFINTFLFEFIFNHLLLLNIDQKEYQSDYKHYRWQDRQKDQQKLEEMQRQSTITSDQEARLDRYQEAKRKNKEKA